MNVSSLPQRSGPQPLTHKGMPHAQIGVQPVPDVNAELFRRAYALPDVERRPTIVSVPGAQALWLREGVPLAHPEAIAVGREFAHIHPDGSLHVSLPEERAREAIQAGWAEPHPMAQYMGNLGMVMLYTPRMMEELDVVFQLIVDSYNFVTGRGVNAAEIAEAPHA
ncbi:MAG: phospholipase [Chloroflexi bacterium]|nr:phospholipase [Chloroflexota bacterium]